MPCLELHCHTIYSKDSLFKPEQIIQTCDRKGIDRIAITDHNSIVGAVKVKEISPERVIVGEEIFTTNGELLGYFVQERIPPGLNPDETIERLREQNAFISVSHPFDAYRKGAWNQNDLLDIVDKIDAIETFNARCMLSRFNLEAEEFAEKHGLLKTVGSDAHHPAELGKARLITNEFIDSVGFSQALVDARQNCRLSSPLVHFYSRYAVWYKKRKNLIQRYS
jgi:predicted metal-dependent phosphoesterase TrpH